MASPGGMAHCCATLAVLAVAVGSSQPVWAADSCGEPREVTGRPRIGLALAGGGGKGWAHIGVLKVLEELHVPIDCIAGTSAGSIVGGVYASGVSPQAMEQAVLAADWSSVFQDVPPRQDLSIDRKILDLRGLWALELGVGKEGVKVPSGLFAGQEVNAFLRRMTLRAVGTKHFDELDIPFRAVATDLRTGEIVVLDRGDLAAAMRASLAVPGAFTPEPLDGRLLVDGGLKQNLPVETVRAMGADVVIAVDLGSRKPTDAQLANPLGVAQQMVNIFIDENVKASLATLTSEDVLIRPQVDAYSSGNFAMAAQLVPIGEKAARAVAEKLRGLALPPAQYAALREQQRGRPKASAMVSRVEVDASHLRHVNPAYVKKKLEAGETAGALDEQHVRAGIAGLLGEGDYERIDYGYLDQDDGERVLLITPREKPWGPGYLRFGLRLATDFKDDAGFNVLGSYRRYWVNRLGAQWRNDFSLGQRTGLRTELYQPVALDSGLFVAPSLAAVQYSENIFAGNDAIARYRIQEAGGRLDVGWTFGRYAELRLGVESGGLHYEPSIAVPFAPSADIQTGGLAAGLLVDRLDSASFPRSGYFLTALYRNALESLGSDAEYQKAVALATTSLSAGRHTVQLDLRGGGALEGDLPVYDLVALGGLFNLSGYQNYQLQGQTFALGRAAYYYRLARVPVVLRGLYAGVSLELGQVWGRLDGSSASGLLPAAALFLGADSAIGPFYLAYGHGFEDNMNTIYLYLGTFY